MDVKENCANKGKDAKVCLTTVVTGAFYQEFIPFLLYSCNFSYPQYDMVIFVYGKLCDRVRNMVEMLNLKNVSIIEYSNQNIKRRNRFVHKCLRWVLWTDKFNEYDYLYVVDVDILYVKEPLPIHVQHLRHMQNTDLSYDNLRRITTVNPSSIVQVVSRIRRAGFRSLKYFLRERKVENRVSGLHFVDVKKYYSILSPDALKKYERMLETGEVFDHVMSSSDEAFLYHILKEEGLSPDSLSCQTDSVSMLDFTHCDRMEFRPHHGIHLGMFRGNYSPFLPILQSSTYSYYVKSYKEFYKNDPVYNMIVENADKRIRKMIQVMEDYYHI